MEKHKKYLYILEYKYMAFKKTKKTLFDEPR